MNRWPARLEALGRPAARLAAALFGGFIAIAIAYGAIRVVRSGWLFYYTEGNVLASLGAFLGSGDLAALYPADGWVAPPLVMTLYPPLYILLSAGLAALTSTETSLLAPRLVAAAAILGTLAMVTGVAIGRRTPAWYLVIALGTLLLAPPISNLLAGAQVDTLALLWTVIGAAIVIDGADAEPRRLWAALPLFALAFFTKQSFVMAPLALVVALCIGHRWKRAASFAAVLTAVIAVGVLCLDRVTAGGYVLNTVTAVTGATSVGNLTTTLLQSRPLQWLPAVLLLLVWAVPLRLAFLELWVIGSLILNVAATVRIGASVNYLLEPLFALLLLGLARYQSGARVTPSARGHLRPAATVVLTVWAAAVTLPRAGQALGVVRTMARGEWTIHLDGYASGYPLVDAQYIPAVRAAGAMPYLNDTFAFGVLHQTGVWDGGSLIEALDSRRVPFILTDTDLRLGPRTQPSVPGAEGFAHFWRSPRILRAIRENYVLASESAPYVWRPRTTAATE